MGFLENFQYLKLKWGMGSNPTVANPLGRSPMGEQYEFDTRMGVEWLGYFPNNRLNLPNAVSR